MDRWVRPAVEKVNSGPDGKQWLDEARISAAVAELRSMLAGATLLLANRLSTELLRLLLGGITVAGLDGSDGKVANFAGQLWALRSRVRPGDVVVMPLKKTSQIALGVVTGGYRYLDDPKPGGITRWLSTGSAPMCRGRL